MNLHECVALEKGAKSHAEKSRTELYHTLQKADLFSGHTRRWRPLSEQHQLAEVDSDKGVQAQAADLLPTIRDIMSRLYDLAYARDAANQQATADVLIDGEPVLRDVPVTFLLYLEKELTHLHTLIGHTPTPDPAQRWVYDAAQGLLRSEPVRVIKTQKVPKSLEVAKPTDKHPGQYQVYNVDEPVGYNETTYLSGALPADDKKRLLARVLLLRDAVKAARCRANEQAVVMASVAKPLFDWVFAGTALETSSSSR